MTTPPPTPPPVPATSGQSPTGAKWPKVLGIILLVFGVLGLGQGLLAPASVFLTKAQMQSFVDMGAEQEQVDEYISQLKTQSYLSGAVYAILGALLLTGGILMLKRRKVCSPLLQTWAVLKILGGGFVIFRQMSLTELQMEIMMIDSNTMGGKEAEMMESIFDYSMKIGMVFGIIFLAALPIFVIIWLNRSKIRDQIQAW